MIRTTILCIAMALSFNAVASDPCPAGTVTCNQSTQSMGDTSSSADNGQTQSSNSGNSSADNNTGYAVTSGENNLQQSGNAVTQSPEIYNTNGNDHAQSTATGGAATGNRLDSSNINEGNKSTNDNHSSVGNTSATGGNVGDTSSTANGGAGGTSLAGALSGSESTSKVNDSGNASQGQGQSQGIADSGNSSNKNSLGQSSVNLNSQGQSSTNDIANKQGQSSEQGQAQSSRNDNSNANRTGDNRIDASDNSRTTTVTTNVNNSRSDTLFIPVQAPAAPSIIPGSTATVIVGQCGPMQTKTREPVYGTYNGWWRKHQIFLGYHDTVYTDGTADDLYVERIIGGHKVLLGQRAVRTVAVINVAGQRQVGIGGGQTGGGWGNAAVGGGSSMQRVVQTTDLELCEAFRAAEPEIILVERKNGRG